MTVHLFRLTRHNAFRWTLCLPLLVASIFLGGTALMLAVAITIGAATSPGLAVSVAFGLGFASGLLGALAAAMLNNKPLRLASAGT